MGVDAEKVLKIIREHPEAIIEALSKKPGLPLGLLARVTPLERLATREDVRSLRGY